MYLPYVEFQARRADAGRTELLATIFSLLGAVGAVLLLATLVFLYQKKKSLLNRKKIPNKPVMTSKTASQHSNFTDEVKVPQDQKDKTDMLIDLDHETDEIFTPVATEIKPAEGKAPTISQHSLPVSREYNEFYAEAISPAISEHASISPAIQSIDHGGAEQCFPQHASTLSLEAKQKEVSLSTDEPVKDKLELQHKEIRKQNWMGSDHDVRKTESTANELIEKRDSHLSRLDSTYVPSDNIVLDASVSVHVSDAQLDRTTGELSEENVLTLSSQIF